MPQQAKRDIDTKAPAFIGRPTGAAAGGVRRREDGPVTYLEADSLEKPIEMPMSDYRRLIPILLLAILLSAAVIIAYNMSVMGDVQKTRDAVAAAIDRDVSLDLPPLQEYAGKTNEAMLASLKSAGYTIYDNTNDEDRNVDGFDVFKVASDMDAEKAANAYSQGLENLGAVDTARYLKGSWRFLVSRANGAEIRLRYADFDASDPKAAIQAAAEAQGFEDANIADAAVDTMGNTNLSGTFKKDKVEYTYTISSCDLSQVYDIEGIPENAQFVGIRVTESTAV
ncbi:MAG: hypothetical protein Q4D34_06225 [Eggerthellaceae bacterium]|nr:hypothetical protein [Eggerthellaceae bacterium]